MTPARWLPPAKRGTPIDAFDLRPGGRFRLTLAEAAAAVAGKAGNGPDAVAGRFDRPGPALAGAMRIDRNPAAGGAATRVASAATGLPPGIRPEDQGRDIAASPAQIAARFAPPPRRTPR